MKNIFFQNLIFFSTTNCMKNAWSEYQLLRWPSLRELSLTVFFTCFLFTHFDGFPWQIYKHQIDKISMELLIFRIFDDPKNAFPGFKTLSNWSEGLVWWYTIELWKNIFSWFFRKKNMIFRTLFHDFLEISRPL